MSDVSAMKPVRHVLVDCLLSPLIVRSEGRENTFSDSVSGAERKTASVPCHQEGGMTREEWLARCAMAYDVGLVTDPRLKLMGRWLTVVMQEGHARMTELHPAGAGKRYGSRWE